MSNKIINLEPKTLWKNFYELTQIPRPSKKEGKVIQYIIEFCKEHNLDYTIDEVQNIIIRKAAKKGFENHKKIVLQAHLDIVPQKNSDKVHDFEKDPIEAYIDNEWVTANGTTLGADNGIGVAAILAIFMDNNIEHGALEALLTIDEETGMTGAFGLKPGLLDADILLNLDSEDEGELYIGCAGGVDTSATFEYTEEDVPEGFKAFKVSVGGLKGGHSGIDIILKRANANKVMNRILINANENLGLRLASIQGGSLRNAIPRESVAIIVIPEAEVDTFMSYPDEIKEMYLQTASEDTKLNVTIEPTDMPDKLIDVVTLDGFLNSIHAMPNGVYKMSEDIKDVVETSSNLAIIKSANGKIEILSMQRSSSKDTLSKLCKQLANIFDENGGKAVFGGEYPGWKPNPNSEILNTMKSLYNKMYNKTPEVKVIHAGLECGLLGSVYPNWDMISFGPTIRFPHSPDEKVNIETVSKFWDFLLNTLKNSPLK